METRPAGSGTQYATRDGRRDDGTYEVQPNDNYWLISEKLYGTGAYFKALAEHNRRKSARDERLQVGDVIATPDRRTTREELPRPVPEAQPPRGRQAADDDRLRRGRRPAAART